MEFSKQVYSASALQKAAYELASDISVSIAETEYNFNVTVNQKKTGEATCLDVFIRLANDYSLRERLAKQTEPIRNLVMAHAYSKTSFIQK
jgi:His-Xaa-Ser system protein HxsD